MNLFNEEIACWADWGRVYQSLTAFAPLTTEILRREGLSVSPITHLTPGTNAVFRAGDVVVKIFAPAESGLDQSSDIATELFAARRANALGVPSPEVVANGVIEDKYRFAYLVTAYQPGEALGGAFARMSAASREQTGRRLREITDRLNTPCVPFNAIDAIADPERAARWRDYPAAFRAERLDYLAAHNWGEFVFVHGDLCGDNILLTPEGELCLIDFADSLLAPPCYEHALAAVELFRFDRALLRGYFGDGLCEPEALAEHCLGGLLMHDFGGDVVRQRLGEPEQFGNIAVLREVLCQKFSEKESLLW